MNAIVATHPLPGAADRRSLPRYAKSLHARARSQAFFNSPRARWMMRVLSTVVFLLLYDPAAVRLDRKGFSLAGEAVWCGYVELRRVGTWS
jgi:hypothetical protein